MYYVELLLSSALAPTTSYGQPQIGDFTPASSRAILQKGMNLATVRYVEGGSVGKSSRLAAVRIYKQFQGPVTRLTTLSFDQATSFDNADIVE